MKKYRMEIYNNIYGNGGFLVETFRSDYVEYLAKKFEKKYGYSYNYTIRLFDNKTNKELIYYKDLDQHGDVVYITNTYED